jgi:oxygen-independent coproporphyrinogen-3 oxidase
MKAVAMESSTNFDLSIYIHYPFCKAKCPYCDFNSHRTDSSSSNLQWNDYSKFYEVYKSEIEYYARYILQGQKRKIKTIFFGGGTPSLMSGELVGGVINEIKNKIASNPEDFVDKKIEITLEANPSSVEADKFVDFSSVGVNRLSIGLQALNDNDLKTLGRVHNLNESIKAVDIARQNFDNYSIDLIYARHKQSVQEWNGELNFAIKNLAKNHISAYSLTIERGTKYFNMHKKGDIIVPDTD